MVRGVRASVLLHTNLTPQDPDGKWQETGTSLFSRARWGTELLITVLVVYLLF